MFDANRRKYPRANYPLRLTMWLANHNETILANAANIGIGGLCVYLNEAFGIGTKVDLEIFFPDTTTPFKCRGTIVRSKPDKNKFYDTGIQFEGLDELKNSFLSGHVSKLIELENKVKS